MGGATYRWIIVCFCLTGLAAAQTQTKGLWADWEPFLGTWQGVGSGEPGQGHGEFTFESALQGAVLTCHNYAEYPASKDKAAYRHDDLMVIYPDDDNKKTRADYNPTERSRCLRQASCSCGKARWSCDR